MLDDIIHLINTTTVTGVIKVGILIGLIVYILFAFILTRQVDIMSKTVNVPLSGFLKLLALLHFIAATLLFALVFFFV